MHMRCTFQTSFLPLSTYVTSFSEGQPLPVDSIGSLMHQLVPRTPAWPISGNSQYITKCFLLILSQSFLHEFLLKGNSDWSDTLHRLSLYPREHREQAKVRESAYATQRGKDNNELLIPYVKVIHCRAMALCKLLIFLFNLQTLNSSIDYSIRLPSTLDT